MSGILAYQNDWIAGPQQAAADLGGSPEKAYAACSSPWYTPGSKTGMVTIQRMFDFARFLWKYDSTFQQAIKRVIGYFLTDLEYYDPTHMSAEVVHIPGNSDVSLPRCLVKAVFWELFSFVGH